MWGNAKVSGVKSCVERSGTHLLTSDSLTGYMACFITETE
jgi:hypothetical protein